MATATTFVRGRVTDRTVLLVASFGAFLAFLDATVVNVAFPNIRDSFPDSTISSLSWILNAYSIVFAAFLIVSGRIADLLGRRRAFTTGVLVFTIASVVCALAPSVGFLVGAREAEKYGVVSTPTFLIGETGKPLTKFDVNLDDAEAFKAAFDELLKP